MFIYIRHGDDDYSDPTYKHDTGITKKGKMTARKLAEKLHTKYGTPNVIYCSPFRRAKETVREMVKIFPENIRKDIKIIYDSNLSRYFSSKEKKNPKVSSGTLDHRVPIYESWNDFKRRVDKHIKEIEKKDHSANKIWCITHALVYKRVSHHYGVKIPDYIPFLHYFVVYPKNKRLCPKCQNIINSPVK